MAGPLLPRSRARMTSVSLMRAARHGVQRIRRIGGVVVRVCELWDWKTWIMHSLLGLERLTTTGLNWAYRHTGRPVEIRARRRGYRIGPRKG